MKTGFKISPRNIIVAVLALALFIGAFIAVRFIIVTNQIFADNTGAPVLGVTPTAEAAAADLPTAEPDAPAVDLPPTWDGASRVTILLLGVDTEVLLDPNGAVSPDRVGPARSDTMILLTIDPHPKPPG